MKMWSLIQIKDLYKSKEHLHKICVHNSQNFAKNSVKEIELFFESFSTVFKTTTSTK